MNERKRILFVDDEQDVLHGLERMLWDMADDWDIRFALSGAEALEMVEAGRFDVVVSDMRMPVMDGAQLLGIIQEKCPDTVRLILSGHSDRAMALESVKPAHQFLAKPCSPERLKRAVAGALQLGGLLKNPLLKGVLSRIDSMPVMPMLYMEVCRELDNENVSLENLGRLISRDVGMTAGILKVVNSAFFGLARHISSPEQAVSMLGTDVIRALILGKEIFTRFDTGRFEGVSFDRLWEHSLLVGHMSREIGRMEGLDRSGRDDCFIAGILHDIGKLLVAEFFSEEYREILRQLREEAKPVWVVELDVLHATHAEIGAYLVGLWGGSAHVIEALAWHHEVRGAEERRGFRPLVAVHAANCFEHELRVVNSGYAQREVDMEFMQHNHCERRVDAWRRACRLISRGEA